MKFNQYIKKEKKKEFKEKFNSYKSNIAERKWSILTIFTLFTLISPFIAMFLNHIVFKNGILGFGIYTMVSTLILFVVEIIRENEINYNFNFERAAKNFLRDFFIFLAITFIVYLLSLFICF